MRSGTTRYPVDRYLDKNNKKFELVNIIDDDIWNPEPALRPEDEMILRKLHEMLQSTADDLKLLSGELAKYHEPGVVYKTPPTPLDEEFNEKVHIEEVVNAKFRGHKIIDKPKNVPSIPVFHPTNSSVIDLNPNIKYNKSNSLNIDIENRNSSVSNKKPVVKKLGFSRTRILQINEKKGDNLKSEKLNNTKVLNNAPAVGYNEYCFTYVEPKVKESPRKVLQVQDMPSINIRSELKPQKVLQLDIFPDSKEKVEESNFKSNVAVIDLRHETELTQVVAKQNVAETPRPPQHSYLKEISNHNQTIRKVSKMSTCDSSDSTNNVSSDTKVKLGTQKRIISSIINSPKNSARSRTKKTTHNKNEVVRRHRANLDEWKRKLNIVYGASACKKDTKNNKSKSNLKKITPFNNTEYIPYSKLTVGGVRASDIEKEISDLPNKRDVPLSPILDKILNSRENSFHKDKILNTSDENLLQEVIDIERSVSDTLSKNIKKVTNEPIKIPISKEHIDDNNSEDNESYADDFEDDKSENSRKSDNKSRSKDNSEKSENKKIYFSSNESDSPNEKIHNSPRDINITYTKTGNLSFKDSVDIFEFIHSVDTQDTATQSNATQIIYPKETQTSPSIEKSPNSIQPIHNDLWPSTTIDPQREVEKMFELEKDFIKKLIIEEYGDILEKSINKPSTSNENKHADGRNNVTALQKNTQTSPARVKSVMTSPQRTKTRTTSPMILTAPVDKITSPMIVVTNDDSQNIDNIKSDAEDISVNLSSPRFSLRLPQTSREVLSNITAKSQPSKISFKIDNFKQSLRKTTISSSSSIDADNSSSELSSLGEIKIRRKFKRRIPSLSECSSSSTLSKYSNDLQSISILPLKSEGEVSWKNREQVTQKMGKSRQSEGETSFGPK